MVGSICRNGQVLVISAHHTVHRYTGTPHHVLSCESQRTPQWVGHHPAQKKSTQKKKSIHNFSQLFTTFHIFSQFFTTFHQPSQFCSGFRVVKICENLSHFVKICEMHTPREAPIMRYYVLLCAIMRYYAPIMRRYALIMYRTPHPLGIHVMRRDSSDSSHFQKSQKFFVFSSYFLRIFFAYFAFFAYSSHFPTCEEYAKNMRRMRSAYSVHTSSSFFL